MGRFRRVHASRSNTYGLKFSLIWRERVEVERILPTDNAQLTDSTRGQKGQKRRNGESRHNLGTIL
jgi:hypothetical protein